MSHESNKKRTAPRRLTLETMEDRLLLSISPTGPTYLQDLVEVEYVPSTTHESSRVDVLDFNALAEQYNSVLVDEHIGKLARLPEMPDEGAVVKLDNPATFLYSATKSEGQATYGLAIRLSDELAPIDWDAIRAESQTSAQGDSATAVIVPSLQPEASGEQTERHDGDAAFISSPTISENHEDGRVERDDASLQGDSLEFSDRPVNPDVTVDLKFDVIIGDFWALEVLPPFAGENSQWLCIDMAENFGGLVQTSQRTDFFSQIQVDLEGISLSIDDISHALSQAASEVLLDRSGMIDMELAFSDAYQHENRNGVLGAVSDVSAPLDLAAKDGFINSFAAENDPRGTAWLRFLPDGATGLMRGDARYSASDLLDSSWSMQTPPPSFYDPGNMDVLQAAASMYYQELFAGRMDAYGAYSASLQSYMSPYYLPQTTSYSPQNLGSGKNLDETGSLFGLIGSGDGTTVKLDADQVGLLENQTDLDATTLKIKGLMNTPPEEFLGNAEINTGEEGGMIDLSVAMKWSSKPVAATPEGIVEASTQRDDKVAFEGTYGRGQTFELATAIEEDDAKPEKDPTLEDVSASLMEKLNQTPLNTNNKENLDKTDASPSMHEVAIVEVTNELDHAAMLPTNALAWVTFALVGRQTLQHPNEEKKKKKS